MISARNGAFQGTVPDYPQYDEDPRPHRPCVRESGVSRVFGHRLNQSRANCERIARRVAAGPLKTPPDASQALCGHEFLVKELQLKPRPFKMGKAVASRRAERTPAKLKWEIPIKEDQGQWKSSRDGRGQVHMGSHRTKPFHRGEPDEQVE